MVYYSRKRTPPDNLNAPVYQKRDRHEYDPVTFFDVVRRPGTLQCSALLRGGDLFLKSLDITGFKSFARSTRFEFTPGITALVGPNGSGKSNVVDAIRWCLGEQSVRDLRGQRAEDVIYAGSRHVLGAAEVSLTFASTEHETPAEVNVARRLYRSGDSEYLVDGRKARLRDLLDRLRELGIDGSRHIVVTQGMADALLSAAPIERRSLLVQAAGLSGYRVRRDEARQKLGTTEQNIGTIMLVLEELEPRLRTLRRQARAVQEREEAQSIFRSRLHDWYAARWTLASSELSELQTRMKEIAAQRALAESRLAELENASEAALRDEREWQQRVDMLVAANRALERDREAADRVRAETEQRLIALRSQRVGLDARIQRAHAAANEAEQRVTSVEQSTQEAEADVSRARAAEEALAGRVAAQRHSCEQAEDELLRVRGDARAHDHDRNAMLERGAQLRRELDHAKHRHENVQHWLESARGTIVEGERESEALAAELAEAQLQISALADKLEGAEVVVADRRARGVRIEAMLSRMKAAATVAQRRRDAAQRSLETYNVDDSVSVLHLISVQPGWESSVAAALGPWAHTPVLGSSARSMHEGDLPGFDAWRDSLQDRITPGIWADSVVQGFPDGRMNPLCTIVFVETGADARRIWHVLSKLPAYTLGTPAVRVVSRDGASWDAVGHAAVAGDDLAASYLRVKREAATMARRSRTILGRISRLEAAHNDTVAHRRHAETIVETIQAELRACRKRHTDLEARLAGMRRQRVDLDARSVALQTELEQLESSRDYLTSEFARWEAARKELDTVSSDLERRVVETASGVEVVRASLAKLEHERSEARRMHEVALATLRAQSQLHSAIRSELLRLQHEVTTGTADLADIDRSTQRLEGELASGGLQVERLDRLLSEHSAGLAAARAARPARHMSGEQVREARMAVSNLVRQDERAQAETANAGHKVDTLRTEMAEDLQVTPADLNPSDSEPPSDGEIKRLRSRAMQYADTDPSVVAEAVELAERHAYLLKHVDDLRGAAETLRVMMEVADAEMRTQFDAAFASVSQEFSRVFEVMLRGGQARLEQLDGGGIDVVAQLPGKRSRSSSAFSGGERSLIASSLLFGVLRMRPAPFCVLDEVDAALDEGNVDRYLAALRDISLKTQAIVVTHNRATMAAADVLYGLTMDSEGTSKVLSLRLEAQAAG